MAIQKKKLSYGIIDSFGLEGCCRSLVQSPA